MPKKTSNAESPSSSGMNAEFGFAPIIESIILLRFKLKITDSNGVEPWDPQIALALGQTLARK